MANPNQLFLLADHIKLALLERQRAPPLHIDEAAESGAQDGHIARSLEQFHEGIERLRDEERRAREGGDENTALTLSDALPTLQTQLTNLTTQFHGFPTTTTTTTTPNPPMQHPPKTVRFTDPTPSLFDRYTDSPSPSLPTASMTNTQIHAYHSSVLAEQDDQLDRLGASIGRQRELSMRMGDELEAQVELLDETDGLVERHQGRLERASRQLGKVARTAGESRQMVAIVVLIIVLVLLIAVLK